MPTERRLVLRLLRLAIWLRVWHPSRVDNCACLAHGVVHGLDVLLLEHSMRHGEEQHVQAYCARLLPARVFPELFVAGHAEQIGHLRADRKSTRLNSSHQIISYAVFCLKKKNITSTGQMP